MIKKIAPFFAYTLFFFLALIYFTPKVSIYYFLESALEKKDIIISGEDAKDRGIDLLVSDADISFKSIQSAKIAKSSVKIYGVYNSINLSNITLSSAAKSFVPLHIESVSVIYSILNPLKIKASGVGGFGVVDAWFDIMEFTLHVELTPTKIMEKKYKNSLGNFTKNEDGELCYDKSF